MATSKAQVLQAADEVADRLIPVYEDLHQHPELSFSEHRTAGIIAQRLGELGYQVHTGIGRTGVVGVMANGDGPTVLVRADMDALPVREQTGLDYASTERGIDPDGNDVPVMHACGHDMHVTALLGASELLAGARDSWRGTLIALFQPAEENGGGAQVMVDDGLFERVPTPDIVLGQHVMPLPAGVVGAASGPAFAATDELDIRLFGRGGHGSQPESTVDPVVMAAATVMRLQAVVSREVAGAETAVVTVGQLHAGTKNNIIPDEARLGLNIRSYALPVRDRVVAAVRRIAKAEAAASGAEREPEITERDSFPVLVNDPDATAVTLGAFREAFGDAEVINVPRIMGSEDVGNLSSAAGAPLVYWLLGGADHSLFEGVEIGDSLPAGIPSNHSPFFALMPRETLRRGVSALVVAALAWLGDAEITDTTTNKGER